MQYTRARSCIRSLTVCQLGVPSIGVRIFSVGLVDPKQGGSSSAGGPPDLVAVEGVCSSRECRPIALAVGELDPKHASALWSMHDMPLPFGGTHEVPAKATEALRFRWSCTLRTSSSSRGEPLRLPRLPRTHRLEGICPSTPWLSWVGRVDVYSFRLMLMDCLCHAKLVCKCFMS